MTPSALVLKGDAKWPDGDKLKKHGIKRLYYEANDPQVDEQFLQELRLFGYQTGVMRDPVWTGYPSPSVFVQLVNADIKRLSHGDPMPVMLDVEIHDPRYVLAVLNEFRRTNPGRNVAWTLEHGQAGWFTPELVALINNYPQLRILPQLYDGPMSYTVDSHYSARDLKAVNDNRLAFFHSLREPPLPRGWDGCLYLENWAQLP